MSVVPKPPGDQPAPAQQNLSIEPPQVAPPAPIAAPAPVEPPPAPVAPPVVVTPQPFAAAPPIAPPPPVADPDLDDEDRRIGAEAAGDKITLPRSAFKDIKDRARRAGARTAQGQLEESARRAGFEGFDGAMSALRDIMAARDSSPEPITPDPDDDLEDDDMAKPTETETPPPRQISSRARRRMARMQEEHARVLQGRDAEKAELQRQAQALQAELASHKVETDLRFRLMKSGIADTDYGLMLVKREIEGKDDAALKKFMDGFDEWTGGLKTKLPYLFPADAAAAAAAAQPPAEAPAPPPPVPANTAPVPPQPSAAAPSPVQPGAPGAPQVPGVRKRAQDMTPGEYSQALREKGWGVSGTLPRR